MSWRSTSSSVPCAGGHILLSAHRLPSPPPSAAPALRDVVQRKPQSAPLTLQEYVVPGHGTMDRSMSLAYHDPAPAPRLTIQDYVIPSTPALPSNTYVTHQPVRSSGSPFGSTYLTQPGSRVGPVFFDDAPSVDSDADRTPVRGLPSAPAASRGPQFAEYVGVNQRVRSEGSSRTSPSGSGAPSPPPTNVIETCDDDWLRANPSRAPALSSAALATALLSAATEPLPPGVSPELFTSAVAGLIGHLPGGVTEDVFMTLFKSLGPLAQMGAALCRLLAEEWFYSFASAQDVERYLSEAGAEPGGFMVRFYSESNLGVFLVSYLNADSTMRHVQVRSMYPQKGFSYVLADGERRSVATLVEAVEDLMLTDTIRTPLVACLADHVWFHGCLAADTATNILNHCVLGTYLFRFSGQKGAFAVSEVLEDRGMRTVAHTRLVTASDGWLCDPVTQKRWRSLESFVSLAALKYPHPSLVGNNREIGKEIREAMKAGK